MTLKAPICGVLVYNYRDDLDMRKGKYHVVIFMNEVVAMEHVDTIPWLLPALAFSQHRKFL